MMFDQLTAWRLRQPSSVLRHRSKSKTYPNMTQHELARLLGMCASSVQGWEANTARIPSWLPLVLDVLDVKAKARRQAGEDAIRLLEELRPDADKQTRKKINIILDKNRMSLK